MSNRRAFFQVVSPQHPNLLAGLGFENYRILKIDSCRNNAAVRAELNRLNIAVSGNEEHIRLIEINAHNPDPIARLDIPEDHSGILSAGQYEFPVWAYGYGSNVA
jgi:hypothetical protein